MAKRHYDITKHDRAVDRENLEHRKRPVKEGHYEGEYGRRHQEMEDMGMIREDKNAIANLPQDVMIKPWDKTRDYMPEVLNDTIRGIDRQIDEDERGRSKNFNHDKHQF